jgi:hypothetical protein
MKLARTALYGAVSLALAAGSAVAADKDRDPGFNALDRNNDGWVTRAEATGNPYLSKRFKAADRNNDGKLNRVEYLAAMTKKDLKLDGSASSGASASSKDRDPGFNALDRNNDGWITRAEAGGNPYRISRGDGEEGPEQRPGEGREHRAAAVTSIA